MFWLKSVIVATATLVSIPVKPNLPVLPKPILPKIPDIFPIDQNIGATLSLKAGDRESKIEINCKVEKTEDEYLYTYTITNTGKYTLGFRWSILDKITGAEVIVMMLEPDQSKTITVGSDKLPVYASSQIQVWLLIKTEDKAWKEDFKKFRTKVSDDFFHPVIGDIKGPVPINFY